MTDTFYSDWEPLVAAAENKITEILKEDVAKVAEDILKKHIITDIYNVYTPKNGGYFAGRYYETAYHRRNELPESVYSYLETKRELMVTSNTRANTPLVGGYSWSLRYPGSFLEMLEKGNLGVWREDFPRPAVSNTEKDFNTNTKISAAIQRGIKRKFK